MIDSPSFPLDIFEWDAVPVDSIELSSDEIGAAVQLAQTVAEPDSQWDTYLQALALAGFQKWLGDRAPDLPFQDRHCSIWQPVYSGLIASACNIQVGAFKVCLIVMGSMTHHQVHLPRAAVELPPFVAHHYVLVEILEEQEHIRIRGYLRYDQWNTRFAQARLVPDSEWTYSVPLSWFSLEPNTLLLELRNLEASVICLPTVIPQPSVSLEAVQRKLSQCVPQLQAGISLASLLTWDEAVHVLMNPSLADWLAQVRQTPVNEQTRLNLQERIQTLSQAAVNAGLWLRNQLDEMAQALNWQLLPAIAPVGLRSPVTEGFESVLTEITHHGLVIPYHARGAYRDLRWSDISLRLHAMTWSLLEESGTQEWILLLILGAPFGKTLPRDVTLSIRDDTQILVEQALTDSDTDEYLYAQVMGNWNERFWVTVSMGNGTVIALPPFAFE
ncbi:MAG: DUF1822 family protein [Elainellaceae cyanobacterium]